MVTTCTASIITGPEWLHSFESYFSDAVNELDCTPELKDAAAYSIFPGGKRIRPLFVLALYSDLGGTDSAVLLPAAAALELVHCSSLIHDDLPGLDNDDLRRGKPTVHKKYGEGIAVLTGDFMLPWAFALLCRPAAEFHSPLVACLADAYMAVCDGQVIDITKNNASLRMLHEKKTAALFECAAAFGAIMTGASAELVSKAAAFGKCLGLLFQAVDDVLDGEGEGDGSRQRFEESIAELEQSLAALETNRRFSHSREIIRKTVEQLKSERESVVAALLDRF